MKFTWLSVQRILQAAGLDVTKARQTTGKIIDALAGSLVRGEAVEIRGLGGFEVKEHAAHKARNPKTGEVVMTKPRRRVLFRPGRELKAALAGRRAEPGEIPELAEDEPVHLFDMNPAALPDLFREFDKIMDNNSHFCIM